MLFEAINHTLIGYQQNFQYSLTHKMIPGQSYNTIFMKHF